MTHQKCPVLLMCRDSISEGFFHTSARQVRSPWRPRIALRSPTGSATAILDRFIAHGFPYFPLRSGTEDPPPAPPCAGARLGARGGRRGFFEEFLRGCDCHRSSLTTK